MKEFNEPLWVGIDIDAEWNTYKREEAERARAESGASTEDTRRRRRGVLPSLLAGGSSPAPRAAVSA